MPEYRNSLGQPIGAPLEIDLPRPPPPHSSMTGRYAQVVPADVAAHAEGLFEAFSTDREGRIWTYLPYGPFESAPAFRDWMVESCTGEDPLFHAILDPAGRPLGLASFLRIDTGAGVIEVGHVNFAPALQRTAAATEAMFLMMRRVFDELGYRRYEWKCDALNAGSRRAAERLGFAYEGTFRKARHSKGRNRDTAWYSIVNDEWPRLRTAFEAWLDPANFGADGRQKTPLAVRQDGEDMR